VIGRIEEAIGVTQSNKKWLQSVLIYTGGFFVIIGVISVFLIKGLEDVITLPLSLFIGVICLIIGFSIRDVENAGN
jgi:hypothetical protein